jgi:hypothetical protein
MKKVREATKPTMPTGEDDSESPIAENDVSEMKPTFRQLRSLNETEAVDEVTLFVEENDEGDNEESVATIQFPGAFRAGPSSMVENEESTFVTEDDEEEEVYVALDTQHGVSSTHLHVESGHIDRNGPLEAKIVDDSMVEAEVQARVQEELRQRPLVEAMASRNVKLRRAIKICCCVVLGIILVVALLIGLIAALWSLLNVVLRSS